MLLKVSKCHYIERTFVPQYILSQSHFHNIWIIFCIKIHFRVFDQVFFGCNISLQRVLQQCAITLTTAKTIEQYC